MQEMDLKRIFQMEEPAKKNILLRYDSTATTNRQDLSLRNITPPKKNVLTKTKLKMSLPISEAPSSQSKVSHWLNDCSNINFNTYQRPQMSTNGLLHATQESVYNLLPPPPPPPIEFEMDVSVDDRTVKHNILVRQDFHKNEVKKSVGSMSKIRQSIDSNSSIETNRMARKLLNTEAPLSPETRKKNELCSYLQLMDLKHPELKNGNIYKNRRSTRVKNLLIMTEKKELESKLRDEAKVKIIENGDQNDSLSKKSLQESNITPECDNAMSNTLFFECFRPVHIPSHLLIKKVDFEDSVKDFISEHQQFKKKEKYMKAKKNIMKKIQKEALRKLQLERLKTLRNKKKNTMRRSPEKYVKKKVANFKKTNAKYISSVRLLRSNKVILRSKTNNLRKHQQTNTPVKNVVLESKQVKDDKKKIKKESVEGSSGKENHKKKDIQIKTKNNLNLRNLRRSSLRARKIETNSIIKTKHKKKKVVNKLDLKLTITENKKSIVKEDEVSVTVKSPDELKHRNPFKILKYDFKKQKKEEVNTNADLKNEEFTKIRYNFAKDDDDIKSETLSSKSKMIHVPESEKVSEVSEVVEDDISTAKDEVIENRVPSEVTPEMDENEVIDLIDDDDDDNDEVVDGSDVIVEVGVTDSNSNDNEMDEEIQNGVYNFEVVDVGDNDDGSNNEEYEIDGEEIQEEVNDYEMEDEVVDNGVEIVVNDRMEDGIKEIEDEVDEVDGNEKEDNATEYESDDSMEEVEEHNGRIEYDFNSNETEDEVNDEENQYEIEGEEIQDVVESDVMENVVDNKEEEGGDGDDDDDVIYIGTIELSEKSITSDTNDKTTTQFSVKTLEDIEKKYSNLSFKSICAESNNETSSSSEELFQHGVEQVVSVTGSTCTEIPQDYQINIAISEHNYTRSPGSVPVEYDPEEQLSPVSEGNIAKTLDVLQEHTLDEIKWIIHGDIVPEICTSFETHDSIEDLTSKTTDKSCDKILNNNEENSCSSVYKLNSCNSISNDSNELVERDTLNLTVQETTNDTCDIKEIQSSLKPIRSNGSHEDFKGFNSNSRQSPEVIEFNENNFSKLKNRRNLHRNLLQNKRKLSKNSDNHKDDFDSPTWTTEKNEKKSAHTINVEEKDGEVLDAYYFDYNLIITQDLMISFWTQSALGFMLEAQNMWVSRGSIQRLALDNNCTQKRGKECVLTTENSFAYVELWTKEHKSDKRERPVADVFAVIYFWRNRQMGPEKKFLQLENINGFADDVQYVVLRNSAIILVSWRMVKDETTSSIIHCYQLASDFQTVVSIKEMESVEHTISSLHNIEDCDTLVMGCGEKQVTIWNLEHGFIVATIDTSDSLPEPLNLWVKCDRGFLLLLQHCSNDIFKLIAINGINHSWKRLQIYKPPPMGFGRFKGVCIEHGILIAFYSNGILCWNVQSGDLIMEELCNDVKYLPSGKHIITYTSDNSLQVKNALSFLITNYDFSES